MKKRDLTEAERALWRRATSDVRRSRPRAAHPVEPAAGIVSGPADGPQLLNAAMRRSSAPGLGARISRKNPASSAPQRHPILGGGDPARDRAAARRRMPIERALDLHGMNQHGAELSVRSFIGAASADDLRLVLVITGKGGEGRGVLRARFLDWVETAPLRGLIARVSSASPRDGGAGAFYVFLKKKGAGRKSAP
ncbi:MAG: Smr/MutS family protein [Parvularculaceae bacterium]